MRPARRQALVAAALMALGFGGAVAWKPTERLADSRPGTDLETMFPADFGDWTLDRQAPVQLISPDQLAVLNRIYNQTLSRTYVNRSTGARVMLSVAYGGDQSDASRAHLPEVCYPAQGFQVSARGNASIELDGRRLPVRQLVARQGARNEPISYWIVVGERIALTGTQQKRAQLAYSVRGVIPDGMLVRVSSIEADADAAFAVHASFVRALARSVDPALLARVFGEAGASARPAFARVAGR